MFLLYPLEHYHKASLPRYLSPCQEEPSHSRFVTQTGDFVINEIQRNGERESVTHPVEIHTLLADILFECLNFDFGFLFNFIQSRGFCHFKDRTPLAQQRWLRLQRCCNLRIGNSSCLVTLA
jgi:hypothetical protein